jgi:hypothetical protein
MIVGTRSTARKVRFVAGVCLFTVGPAGAFSSCGGKHPGSRADAGDASGVVQLEAGVEGGLACQPSSGAAEPNVPVFVTFDGGVPLDQVAYALAVARCNYFRRCSPLAPYVVSECIEALSRTVDWPTWNFDGYYELGYGFPSAALFQAVDAGLVRYDPNQESACLQALQAQSCHGFDLWENIPACAATFTCPPDAEADDGGSSGGVVVDGGAACSAVSETWMTTPGETLLPCSGASDCVEAAWPGGPYCVDGYCSPGPFGDSSYCATAEGVACEFVDAGQPCNAEGVMGSYRRWGAGLVTKFCPPGLTCSGVTNDGGLGVCSTPQDIGGPCTEDAATTGCLVGLTCQCGICQIPPSQGPCASGSCQIGVAYCDVKSNTCKPVAQIGDNCTVAHCSPSLECDSTVTCEPYSPETQP